MRKEVVFPVGHQPLLTVSALQQSSAGSFRSDKDLTGESASAKHFIDQEERSGLKFQEGKSEVLADGNSLEENRRDLRNRKLSAFSTHEIEKLLSTESRPAKLPEREGVYCSAWSDLEELISCKGLNSVRCSLGSSLGWVSYATDLKDLNQCCLHFHARIKCSNSCPGRSRDYAHLAFSFPDEDRKIEDEARLVTPHVFWNRGDLIVIVDSDWLYVTEESLGLFGTCSISTSANLMKRIRQTTAPELSLIEGSSITRTVTRPDYLTLMCALLQIELAWQYKKFKSTISVERAKAALCEATSSRFRAGVSGNIRIYSSEYLRLSEERVVEREDLSKLALRGATSRSDFAHQVMILSASSEVEWASSASDGDC